MLQPINSSINTNSKKIPFGVSYRLNVPVGNTLDALSDLERCLQYKKIPLNRIRKSQINLSDEAAQAVNVIVHNENPEALDIFIKEKTTGIPKESLDMKDSGDIFEFVKNHVVPLFQSITA